jgi:hypothetical protein
MTFRRISLVAAAIVAAALSGTTANAEPGARSGGVSVLNVSPPFDSDDQCERVRAANDLDPRIEAPGPCFAGNPITGPWFYYWNYV